MPNGSNAPKNILPPITETLSIVPLTFAFLMSPIVVAVAGFWIILIPVFAVPFGYIPYLILGVPLILLFAGRIKTRFVSYAILGFCGFAAAITIWFLGYAGSLILDDRPLQRLPEMMHLMLIFGAFFAPIWAGMIPVLYHHFRKPNADPIHPGLHPNIEKGED